MQLTNEERKFVAKRAWFVRTWPFVGCLLMSLVLGLGVWLFVSKPLLANPFVVLAMLKDNSIAVSTLSLMAGLLPLVVLMCIVFALAVLLLSFASFATEKKYIALIQRNIEETGSSSQPGAEEPSTTQHIATPDAAKPRT